MSPGSKFWCLCKRSCQNASTSAKYIKSNAFLNWYRSYDQFSKTQSIIRSLNTDSEVKVIGVKGATCMERYWPRHVCAKYKRGTSFGIGAMLIFRNLNLDFET